MASQIILNTPNESESQHVSSVTTNQIPINAVVSGIQYPTSNVQRIVKTSNGTQIILTGVTNINNVGTIAVSGAGTKRPHSPDLATQPPSKIQRTLSSSNVQMVSAALPQQSLSVGDRTAQLYRNEETKSPQKIMHVGNTALPINARKLVLSPSKGSSKITMVPLNSSGSQIKTLHSTANKVVNVSKALTFAGSTSNENNSVTLSPQKFIIKTEDSNMQNVYIQQNNVNSSSAIASSTANVHPVAVSGSKFQYVRLVSSNPSTTMQTVSTKVTSMAQTSGTVQQRTIAPHISPSFIAPKEQLVNTHIKPVAQYKTTKSSQPTSQRLILPATTQPGSSRFEVAIRPNLASARYSQLGSSSTGAGGGAGTAQALSGLPPGTTFIPSGQNMQGVQGFALVPAQYVTQLQPYSASQPSLQQNQLSHGSTRDSSYHSLQQQSHTQNKPSRVQSNAVSNVEGSATIPSANNRPRKPCNCTKSQCLKLYCECFANGEFCYNCNCNNCFNNLEHEDERSRAIKACLDRNPNAFRPKIGKDKNVKGERRHNKGCNCKRSGCLKNYCECYEAKIMCSHLCKCVGCKNFEESPEKKSLMQLADAAEVRKLQQVSAKHKLSAHTHDLAARPPPVATSNGHRLPYSFVTTDVVEATCNCLIAQAEETERTRQMDTIQEQMILEEFGRCLMQVIESANRAETKTAV